MEIQAKTYYALLVLLDLMKNTSLATATMPALAERNNLSPAFLKKILHALVVEGLVKSVRGPHGGYALGTSVDKITIHNVLQAMKQPLEFKTALKGESEGIKSINAVFGQLHEDILEHYKNIKISDLV